MSVGFQPSLIDTFLEVYSMLVPLKFQQTSTVSDKFQNIHFATVSEKRSYLYLLMCSIRLKSKNSLLILFPPSHWSLSSFQELTRD